MIDIILKMDRLANLFSHVAMAPPDPILGTAVAFKNDPSADKINLGIGAYRDS